MPAPNPTVPEGWPSTEDPGVHPPRAPLHPLKASPPETNPAWTLGTCYLTPLRHDVGRASGALTISSPPTFGSGDNSYRFEIMLK